MQLPFTVTIESPTREDLRRPQFWILAGILTLMVIGVVLLVREYRSRSPVPPVPDATLAISSSPPGATILIAGKPRGQTPATLALPAGEGRVTLRLAAHADVTYTVRLAPGQTMSLTGVLWWRTPDARRVRPPLPGATIVGATFLTDGQLALVVALPSRDERQLWLVERDGDARRIDPPLPHTAVAVTPDGARVAYLAGSVATGTPAGSLGSDTARPNEVWVTGRDGDRGDRRYVLPPSTADERLTDLSWSPDGGHLLLISQQRPQGGGPRTRLLWLDLADDVGAVREARELVSFPSEVVPSSYNWRPDGRRVALLTRTERRTTLCVVATDGGLFRTLTDVAGEGGGVPPFPPLAWTLDGGVVYAASGEGVSNAFGATHPVGLFVEDFSGRAPRRLGEAAGVAGGVGPGQRRDGLVVALTRPKANAPATLRAFDPAAGEVGQDLGALSSPAAPLGLRWDAARGRALVATRGAASGGYGSGGFDLWLIHWTADAGEVAR